MHPARLLATASFQVGLVLAPHVPRDVGLVQGGRCVPALLLVVGLADAAATNNAGGA
jgi:hypothetical protein